METPPTTSPIPEKEHTFDDQYQELLTIFSLPNPNEYVMEPEMEARLETFLKSVFAKKDESLVIPLVQACKDKYLAANLAKDYLRQFNDIDYLHVVPEEQDALFEKPRHFLQGLLGADVLKDENGYDYSSEVLDDIKSLLPRDLLWEDKDLLGDMRVKSFLKKWTVASLANYNQDADLYTRYVEKYPAEDLDFQAEIGASLQTRYDDIFKNGEPLELLAKTESVMNQIGLSFDKEKIITEAFETMATQNIESGYFGILKDVVNRFDSSGLYPREKSTTFIHSKLLESENDITQTTIANFCNISNIPYNTTTFFEQPLLKELATKASLSILKQGHDPRENGFAGFPSNVPGIEAALKRGVMNMYNGDYLVIESLQKLFDQYAGRHEAVLNDPEIQEFFKKCIPHKIHTAINHLESFRWLYARTNMSPEELKDIAVDKARERFLDGDTYVFDNLDKITSFSEREKELFIASVGVRAQRQFIEQKEYRKVGQLALSYEELRPLYYQQIYEFLQVIMDKGAPLQNRLEVFLTDLPTMAMQFGDNQQLEQVHKDQSAEFIPLILQEYDDIKSDPLRNNALSFLKKNIASMDKSSSDIFIKICMRDKPEEVTNKYFHEIIAHAMEQGVDLTSITEMVSKEQIVSIERNKALEDQGGRRGMLAADISKILSLANAKEVLNEITGSNLVGEKIINFVDTYEIASSQKGKTVVALEFLKIIESKAAENVADVFETLSDNLESYKKVLENYSNEDIPQGLHVSIGMEYEITQHTANRFRDHCNSSLSAELGEVAKHAAVGRGNDAAFEVATHPTDNPYMVMLEMKLLSELGYLDFNFSPDTIHEQSARGCHISLGGEQFNSSHHPHVHMVQNMLALSGWAGVPGGREEVSGGVIANHGYSDRVKVLGETNGDTVYEFRGLSLDKVEPFERSVSFLHTAGIGINAFNAIAPLFEHEELHHLLQRIDTSTIEHCMESLAKETILKEGVDEKTKYIAYEYIKMSQSTLNTIKQHNEQFLTQETVGYFEPDGSFIDAESGATVAKRFNNYLSEKEGEIQSLEVFMQNKLTIAPFKLFTKHEDIYSVANRLSNMYLKYRPGEGGAVNYSQNTSANTAAFLSETKIGDKLEFPDVAVGDQKEKSVFDADTVSRKGYYYMQDATPEMLIHKVQQHMLSYQEAIKGILQRKELEVQRVNV